MNRIVLTVIKAATVWMLVGIPLFGAVFEADFENQDVSAWMPFQNTDTVTVTSEEPATGTYSLVILRAGMKLRKGAMIPVQPGKTYQISAMIRTTAGRVRFSVVEFDGRRDWLKGTTFFVGETPSTSWKHVKNTWRAKNPQTRYITLQFDGGDGFADDIVVALSDETTAPQPPPVPPAPKPASKPVPTPNVRTVPEGGTLFETSFEEDDGVAAWMPFKAGEAIELSSDHPASGEKCLRILSAGMKLKKSALIPVVPGVDYWVSAKLRAVTGRVRLSIAEYDANKEWLRVGTFFVGETDANAWKLLEATWRARDPQTRYIALQFDGGDGVADDISVVRAITKPKDTAVRTPVTGWKKQNGTVSFLADDAIHVECGAVETTADVESDQIYGLEVNTRGDVGQRMLFHLTELDAVGKPIGRPWQLIGKENTGGGEGITTIFFTTSPRTVRVRLAMRSVGDVTFRGPRLHAIVRGKTALRLDAAPDRNWYYSGMDGLLNFSVFNAGRRMERFKFLLRLTNDTTGESVVPDFSQLDYGGRVPGGTMLRGTAVLPISTMAGGAWVLRLAMLVDGFLVDMQTHHFGVSTYGETELTRETLFTRSEPVFFMMLSQWGDLEMFRRFRAAGFDVVEPDFTWGEVETAKGIYDWSVIDRTLELARKTGLKIGIKVMCWNLPADLKQRMISSNGDIGDCPPNHGEAYERLKTLWRAIAERYRNHPQVVWYTVSIGLNDGPLHGSFGPCHSTKQCYDYSPDNAKGWGDFLKKKNLTLKDVSALYGTSFSLWNEIPLPPQQTYKYDPVNNPAPQKNIFDWFMEYNAEGVTQGLTGIWRAIRAVDKATPILWKAGGGYHERVPKGFEYDKLLAVCRDLKVIFTSTATPSLTGEPSKIEYARKALPDALMAGEVGAEGERFPAPPLCTAKCFYLTMRYDMQIMGFCVYPSDVPSELWGYIKNMQGDMRGFSRVSGRLRIYGDTNVRTYAQTTLDAAYLTNSPLRQNIMHVETLNLPFSYIYDSNWTELTPGMVLYDAGTPFFPVERLDAIRQFVSNGGTCIMAPTSGMYQPDDVIQKMRQQSFKAKIRHASAQFPMGKGVFYFPDNAAEFEALAVQLGLACPIVWDGPAPLMMSIMQNQKGECKILLFNPTDQRLTGRIRCTGEWAKYRPALDKITLGAASLRIVPLELHSDK